MSQWANNLDDLDFIKKYLGDFLDLKFHTFDRNFIRKSF